MFLSVVEARGTGTESGCVDYGPLLHGRPRVFRPAAQQLDPAQGGRGGRQAAAVGGERNRQMGEFSVPDCFDLLLRMEKTWQTKYCTFLLSEIRPPRLDAGRAGRRL